MARQRASGGRQKKTPKWKSEVDKWRDGRKRGVKVLRAQGEKALAAVRCLLPSGSITKTVAAMAPIYVR